VVIAVVTATDTPAAAAIAAVHHPSTGAKAVERGAGVV
jgi:hypothetical protein